MTKEELRRDSGEVNRNNNDVISGFIVAYTSLVLVGASFQLGHLNPDFVAYVTIAHRTLEHGACISGYWSPLYSWCMIPLIALGINDLVTGRAVLIAGGLIYLLAIHSVFSRFFRANREADKVLLVAAMTCATFQASAWGTSMMDPDLLADGLLFWSLFILLDPALSRKREAAFAGGIVGGLAYLAKAYMLPFLLVIVPVTLALRWMTQRRNAAVVAKVKGGRGWLIAGLLFLAGLSLVAGPWIGMLTRHYHTLTFSTAGSANHADVSPENFGHDPLWNPGLEANFILDPHLSGDWSPFQDTGHFTQQAKVFIHNASNCLGHVAAWLTLWVIAMVWFGISRWRAGRKLLIGEDRLGVWWCAAGIAFYCGGYCMVNLEARYIAPVVSPLLCTGSLLLLRSAVGGLPEGFVANGWRRIGALSTGLMIGLLFSVQDIYRLERAALHHTQSIKYAILCEAAKRMSEAHVPGGRMAANEFNIGLSLAYADHRLATYMGAPRLTRNECVMEQLRNSGVRVYVRWVDRQVASPLDGFVPKPPWRLQLSTKMEGLAVKQESRGPSQLEVYVLPESAK